MPAIHRAALLASGHQRATRAARQLASSPGIACRLSCSCLHQSAWEEVAPESGEVRAARRSAKETSLSA